MKKSYSELILLPTFEDRFRYLKLNGTVGKETFGFERYLNQRFYHSYEWKSFRRDILIRDMGCDLGIEDRIITGRVIIHHMNPIDSNDISEKNIDAVMNPEYVICVSNLTHNVIHYGDESILSQNDLVVRSENDTVPWR